MTSDQSSGLDSDLSPPADGERSTAEPTVISNATETAPSIPAPTFVPVEPPPAPVLVASAPVASAAIAATPTPVAPPVAVSTTVQALQTPEVQAPEVQTATEAQTLQAVQVVQAVEPSKPIILPAADKSSLMQMVQAAGLQWIETDPVRAAQAGSTSQVAMIKLGREPKPVIQVSNTPLVQVETRR